MSILIVTSKTDVTSDSVLEGLEKKGEEVYRFNTEDFCHGQNVSTGFCGGQVVGQIESKYRAIRFTRIKAVYYRRPLPPSSVSRGLTPQETTFVVEERQAFLNWLWKSLRDRFWVSWPTNIKIAESKIDQLRLAPSLGFAIPQTLISNNPKSVKEFCEHYRHRIIVKPVKGGLIETPNGICTTYCSPLINGKRLSLKSISACPCIYQEQVEKQIELRVTVVGDQVFAAEIHSQQSARTRHDWRRYDFENTPHKVHRLPNKIRRSCLKMVKHYGLQFGAFDLVLTPGNEYVFLEMNPNGQWLWIESLTGLKISEAISDLLIQRGRTHAKAAI